MNKALFISNYFPPMGLGGILRTLKLAEYLGRYDWQVVVLTGSPKKLFVVDEYLFDEVRQSEVIIERTGKELKDIGKVVTRVPSSSFQKINKCRLRDKSLHHQYQTKYLLHSHHNFHLAMN